MKHIKFKTSKTISKNPWLTDQAHCHNQKLRWVEALIQLTATYTTAGLGYTDLFESYKASFEREILVPHLNQLPVIKLKEKYSYTCFMPSIYLYLFLQSTVWAHRTQVQILHAPSPEPLLVFPSGLTATPCLIIISSGLAWAQDPSGQVLYKQKVVDSENRSLKHITAWPTHHILTKLL